MDKYCKLNLSIVTHLFDYDREKGVLIWKNPPKNKPFLLGEIAGHPDSHRGRSVHLVIGINGKTYFAHSLIWFLETGIWFDGDIDHKDGNGLNNRFSNLRDVPRRINSQNSYRHRKGKLVGTSFDKRTKRYAANIRIRGKQIFLGRHDTETEAHQAYLSALRSYNL